MIIIDNVNGSKTLLLLLVANGTRAILPDYLVREFDSDIFTDCSMIVQTIVFDKLSTTVPGK